MCRTQHCAWWCVHGAGFCMVPFLQWQSVACVQFCPYRQYIICSTAGGFYKFHWWLFLTSPFILVAVQLLHFHEPTPPFPPVLHVCRRYFWFLFCPVQKFLVFLSKVKSCHVKYCYICGCSTLESWKKLL